MDCICVCSDVLENSGNANRFQPFKNGCQTDATPETGSRYSKKEGHFTVPDNFKLSELGSQVSQQLLRPIAAAAHL
jgi:hypothetical protein